MKKLYFVRHGLSEMNQLGMWAGRINTPLTDIGREQARSAGEAAKDLGIDHIIASPLDRAHETAQIIAKQIGYPLDKIETNSLLMERDFGSIEGTPYNPDLNLDGITDMESDNELIARAHLAIKHLKTIPEHTILVVAHGALGRAMRHHLDASRPFSHPSRIDNAQIIKFS